MSTALAPLHLLLFGGTLADNGIHSASRPPRECHTNPYALLFLLFILIKKKTILLVTRLRSGQRSGRPRTRLEALQIVPTRCPMQIYTYLKSIAPYLYPSLTQMFED